MKHILITGANSYIGTSFEKYIKENFSDGYVIDTICLIDGSWREKSFSDYDSVLHVAGIAHQKETEENAKLYYEINCDLAAEVAKKAKSENVKHFVFLSSMSVYGINTGIVTKDTPLCPVNHYGKSKLKAEQLIENMADDSFAVAILRPPMVYGKGCKGNFQAIKKIVKKLPVFPKSRNKRSMIYIENLCMYVKKLIDGEMSGLFFPTNPYTINTCEMAKEISVALNKKIYLSRLMGVAAMCLIPFSRKFKKAFGTLVYDIDDAVKIEDAVMFKDSVRKSV